MSQELQAELELPIPTDETEPDGPAVPEDVVIELPFPYFLGSKVLDYGPNGKNVPIVLCGKIEKNKTAILVAMNAINQQPMGELSFALPPPPPGVEVAQHWVACLAHVVPEVVQRLEAQIAADKPKILTKPSNLVVVGDLR